MSDIRERDWKVLRDVAEAALERSCKRILDQARPLVTGEEAGEEGSHERYRALLRLLHERKDALSNTFDNLCRSTAMVQLASMRRQGLLTEDEWARFTPETREAVQRLVDLSGR